MTPTPIRRQQGHEAPNQARSEAQTEVIAIFTQVDDVVAIRQLAGYNLGFGEKLTPADGFTLDLGEQGIRRSRMQNGRK
jgi:hypothetical protein